MGIFDNFKNFMGLDNDYDDEVDGYEEQYPVEEEPAPSPIRSRRSRDNVVNIHSKSSMKICIHEPLNYEESPKIVDDLKHNKAVVLNFEQLDMNVKRQIFDFVSGGLYAVEGRMQKVNKDIFILAPPNVEIDGIKEELKNQGVFPW
ncbi:MAG: cell division protein SepF [Tissierellia bacterium]|nr:cell division protein SepF [Tissierellia bacterium]